MSAFVSKLFRAMSHALKNISHILEKISYILKNISHMWENMCRMWEDKRLFGDSALVSVCYKYSGVYKQQEVSRPWLGDAMWR